MLIFSKVYYETTRTWSCFRKSRTHRDVAKTVLESYKYTGTCQDQSKNEIGNENEIEKRNQKNAKRNRKNGNEIENEAEAKAEVEAEANAKGRGRGKGSRDFLNTF